MEDGDYYYIVVDLQQKLYNNSGPEIGILRGAGQRPFFSCLKGRIFLPVNYLLTKKGADLEITVHPLFQSINYT